MAWYFSKLELGNTPSIRDGMKLEAERQHRSEGARFIIETCTKTNLGFKTMATAVVYFQRFYMVHSFFKFPHYFTACSTLLVAGKIEETPKQVKDVIKIAKRYLKPQEFAKFGKEPEKEMLVLERIILQSMKFDVLVDHPYNFLLEYGKFLGSGSGKRHQKIEAILDTAWTFVNDSLWCTTLCLEWEPEVIAIAMLTLAIKFNKYKINNWAGKTNWWEEFVEGLTQVQIEGICHEVLDSCFQLEPEILENQHSPSPENDSRSIEDTSLQKAQIVCNTADKITYTPVSSPPRAHVSLLAVPPLPPPPFPKNLLPDFMSSPPLPPPPLPPSLLTNSPDSLSVSPISASSPLSLSPSLPSYSAQLFLSSLNFELQSTSRPRQHTDSRHCMNPETFNYSQPPPPLPYHYHLM